MTSATVPALQAAAMPGMMSFPQPLIKPRLITCKFPEDLANELDSLDGPRSHHIREAVKLYLRFVGS